MVARFYYVCELAELEAVRAALPVAPGAPRVSVDGLWAIVSLLRHAEGALAHADAVQLMQTDAWRRPDEPDVQG